MVATIFLIFALGLALLAAFIPDPYEPYRVRTVALSLAFYFASLLPLFK
jgi:hypothetical protein